MLPGPPGLMRGPAGIQQLRDLLDNPGVASGLHDRLIVLCDGSGQKGMSSLNGP